MRRVWMSWMVVSLLVLGGCMNSADSDKAVSSATEFGLSNSELSDLQERARAGDCGAALRVARYFSLGRNDSVQSVPWLRRAAACGTPEIKAELVYILLGTSEFKKVEFEVEALAQDIERSNAKLGQAVRSELNIRRARATKQAGTSKSDE